MRGLTALAVLPLAACAQAVAPCDADQASRAIDIARVADLVRQYPTVRGALDGTQRVLQGAARPAPRCAGR